MKLNLSKIICELLGDEKFDKCGDLKQFWDDIKLIRKT